MLKNKSSCGSNFTNGRVTGSKEFTIGGLIASYTMGMSGLPDIYTRSPWAACQRVEGAYIRQNMRAHGM